MMPPVGQTAHSSSAGRIGPAQSVMLDVLRFAAALMVFIGHASGVWLTGGYLWQIGRGTDGAVTIFFVLSGYVVAATLKSSWTAGDYAATRLSRLWSVVLPALLVTFACDAIGQAVAPGFYYELAPTKTEMVHQLGVNEPVRYLLSGLMVQEWTVFGLLPRQPGTNMPFWSLSYELTYYVAFGLILYLRGIWRIAAVALLFLLAGLPILVLWPLWMLGAALWHIRDRVPKLLAGVLLAIGLFGLLGLFAFFGAITELDGAWASPINKLVATNLWVGLSVACFIAGFHVIGTRFDALATRIAKPVRIVADHTFELYLLHIPIVFLAAAIAPFGMGLARAAFVYVLAIGLVILVARWTGPLREALRRRLLGLFKRA